MPYLGKTDLNHANIKRWTGLASELDANDILSHVTLEFRVVSDQSCIITVNGIKQHKSIGVDGNNDPINSYVITESGDISFSNPDFVRTPPESPELHDKIEVFAIVSAGVPFVPSDGSIRKNHLADELKMLTEDAFGGDDVETDFPLSYAPGSASSILVFVDGVHQKAISEYTIVNGTTLRFANAPTYDTENIQNIRVIHLTYSVGVAEIIPLDNTVTTSKIRNDAVTTPKILDDAVTIPKTNFSGTDALQIPAGTTLERPGSPLQGDTRINTTDSTIEFYDSADAEWHSNISSPARNTVLTSDPVTQPTTELEAGFSTTIWAGDNSTQNITNNLDMSTADNGGLVWIKNRNAVQSHYLFDSVRGADIALFSDGGASEVDYAVHANPNRMTSFNPDGFTVKYGSSAGTNATGSNYVSWAWKTNKKYAALTNRGKPYTAHYNTQLGFSIVGYIGDEVIGHEIPHHLGVVPELSIFKNRDVTGDVWLVRSKYIGVGLDSLVLNDSAITTTYNEHIPTDTTILVGPGTANNKLNDNHISYHFASKPGVSKVSSYIGTGQNGNYIECGFKPAFVMIKCLTKAASWVIYDGVRPTISHLDGVSLSPNQDLAEPTISDQRWKTTDTGFALSMGYASENEAGHEYIFLAMAETNKLSGTFSSSWGEYDIPIDAKTDILNIKADTLISFANGFSSSGQKDSIEKLENSEFSFGEGHENKHYWLYRDKDDVYGVTEHRPLTGLTRDDADKYGMVSPSDPSLRTHAPHSGYESSSGTVWGSDEAVGSDESWKAFDHDDISSSGGYPRGWRTNTDINTGQLQYKHTEKRILKSWRLRTENQTSRTPKNFTIEGSNDGLNWNVLETKTDFTSESGFFANISSTSLYGSNIWSPLQESLSSNTEPYLYHRINVTATHSVDKNVSISELEFNTTIPSDYYLVTDGKMYNHGNPVTQINRVYLTELMTDSEGDVSWFKNLPIHKQNFTDVEVHNDLAVHGDVAVHGELQSQQSAKAWVNFSGTGTVVIRDSHNVSSVTDLSVGSYKANFTNNMANTNYSVATSSNPSYTTSEITPVAGVYQTNAADFTIHTRRYNTLSDNPLVCGQVFGD